MTTLDEIEESVRRAEEGNLPLGMATTNADIRALLAVARAAEDYLTFREHGQHRRNEGSQAYMLNRLRNALKSLSEVK